MAGDQSANTPPDIDVSSLRLTFDDEFNTFVSSPTGSAGWMTKFPFGGRAARTFQYNHDAEMYSDPSIGVNPFSIDNGVLSITASRATTPNSYGLPYNSGAITSYKSESQQYGYFEMRAQVPAGYGLWSAFWLEPENLSGLSEIDTMEVLGNNTKQLFNTTHTKINGVYSADLHVSNVADLSTSFHTYGVDWEPTTITWYLDGVQTAQEATPANMNVPMYMIANLVVGGTDSWPGPPNPATPFPATMKIDYIRAYATANTTNVSGTQAILPGTGTASIAGTVLFSDNGGAAGPQAAVAVELLTTAGGVADNTVTDASGRFTFADLVAGDYQILYVPPSGEVVKPGGPAAPNDLTAAIALSTGQAYAAATQTLITVPATIQGDVVFAANSAPGSDLAGLTVQLINAAGAVAGTAVTNGAGAYAFSGLLAESYSVRFELSRTQSLAAGGPANPSTHITGAVPLASGQTYVFAPQTVTPAGANLDGLVLASPDGTAGSGQPGVTVDLLAASGVTIAATQTNAAGGFLFTGLAAGTYRAKFVPPAGDTLETGGAADAGTGLSAPITLATGQAGAVPTQQLLTDPAAVSGGVTFLGSTYWGAIGVTVTLFDASGAAIATTVTDSKGQYGFNALAAGTYQLGYTLLPGAYFYSGYENRTTGLSSQFTLTAGQAFGATGVGMEARSPGQIDGAVMAQADGAAAPQPGVSVSLIDGGGNTLDTVTTDSNGAFLFKNLLTGVYQVQYAAPAGANLQAGGPADPATGITAPIPLAASQIVALAPETLVTNPATLNGSVTFSGAALAGDTVTLLDANGATVATASTDSGGAFQFADLAAASYAVQYSSPAGDVFVTGPGGTSGLTGAIALAPGQTLTLAAEDLAPNSASLSGAVLTAPGAGNGAPLAHVAVSAVNTADGSAVSTTTDANGLFSFASLTPGAYQLLYAAPAGEVLQRGSVADPATGLSAVITLGPGQAVTEAPEHMLSRSSSITGFVEHYGSGDPGTGVSAVAVALLDSGGRVIGDTLTNGAGVFTFGSLAAGRYQVQYSAPTGEAVRSGADANGLSPVIDLPGYAQVNINKEVLSSTSDTFTLSGAGATAVRGNGSYTVTGNASGGMLTLGDGDQSINLTGGGDTIAVGAGSSTITALGAGNTIGTGAGMSFITTDGSSRNDFLLGAAGRGVMAITGFATGDTLDLARTLAGVNVAPDLSNLGSFVTAAQSGASTTLLVDPTGGHGSAAMLAVLNGVSTTVAELVANHSFSLT